MAKSKLSKVREKVERVGKALTLESGVSKKKALGKPKAKITAVDIKKILLKGETGNRRLVTDEQVEREPQEPRSLFFKQEFAQETMGVNKWLS